jgi:hypothetical protein
LGNDGEATKTKPVLHTCGTTPKQQQIASRTSATFHGLNDCVAVAIEVATWFTDQQRGLKSPGFVAEIGTTFSAEEIRLYSGASRAVRAREHEVLSAE